LHRGVRLTTSHVNNIPVAEFVIRSVLEQFHRSDQLRELRERRELASVSFREIYGTEWLIYGMGAIGTEIVKCARSFGARTLGVRRHIDGREPVDGLSST
jgi:phosphoglycerate dehydrogenase-like enzyme